MLSDFIKVNLVDESGSGVSWHGEIRRDQVVGYFDLTEPTGLVPDDYKSINGANTLIILAGISKPMLITQNINQLRRLLDA